MIFTRLLMIASPLLAGGDAVSLVEVRQAVTSRQFKLTELHVEATKIHRGIDTKFEVDFAVDRVRVKSTMSKDGKDGFESRIIVTPKETFEYYPSDLGPDTNSIIAGTFNSRKDDGLLGDAMQFDWRLLGLMPVPSGLLYRYADSDVLSLPGDFDESISLTQFNGLQAYKCSLEKRSSTQVLNAWVIPEYDFFVAKIELSSLRGRLICRVENEYRPDSPLPARIRYSRSLNGVEKDVEEWVIHSVSATIPDKPTAFSPAGLEMPLDHPVVVHGLTESKSGTWNGDDVEDIVSAQPTPLPKKPIRTWIILGNFALGVLCILYFLSLIHI